MYYVIKPFTFEILVVYYRILLCEKILFIISQNLNLEKLEKLIVA